MATWILRLRFRHLQFKQNKQSCILLLALFSERGNVAEVVLEDRAFLRIGEQVFFEKRFLSEIPKIQILKCYFEDSYLLSMEQILPDKYAEVVSKIKNWPKMRDLEREVFNLMIINKIERHFRETGMQHMDRTERASLLKSKPKLSKDCLRKNKIKGGPLSEFQQNIIAMEFALRDRFSLAQWSSIQKTSQGPEGAEIEKRATAEKFMKQYLANVYSQYGHFIFHYAP